MRWPGNEAMEFQSGQNCVTEINSVLCCKSQQDCAMVCKMQRQHAQNAETSCSNHRDVVLKSQRCRAQNAETSCSNCRDLMHMQSEETNVEMALRTLVHSSALRISHSAKCKSSVL